MTSLLTTATVTLASALGEAAEGSEVGREALQAGAAPLLSPLALVALGAGLVVFAMLRTKLRHSSK
ncbi:MAG: hypothetical protein ACF8XB_16810 [Planctomycetota bacterium JB042]